MMARMIGVALLVLMVLTSSVHGQACIANPPEIYNETFDIDKQVDSVRHVQRIVVSNNTRGDYTVEFMATRTDLQATRERWTVTFECNASFKFLAHVSVDGQWRYTTSSVNMDGTRQVTLAVPGASATLVISCTATNDFQAFQAIAAQTAMERSIVRKILQETRSEPDPEPPTSPTPYQQCVENCGPPPLSCPPPEPSGDDFCDCMNVYDCCTDTQVWEECRGHCHCTHNITNYEYQQACYAYWSYHTWLDLMDCMSDFVNCIEQASA